MQVLLSKAGDNIVRLDKFVITLFIDKPKVGICSLFAEVCCSDSMAFHLEASGIANLCSKPELYVDTKTCAKLFTNYNVLNEAIGEHVQNIGKNTLHVKPVEFKITHVASSTKNNLRFHISHHSETIEKDICVGSWLFCELRNSISTRGKTSFSMEFDLCTKGVVVDNCCIFVVLPLNYCKTSSNCELYEDEMTIGDCPKTNPVYEFEYPNSYPIFPIWEKWIYGRKILKNPKPLIICSNKKLSFSFQASSDSLSGKVATRSYFIGVALALFVSMFTKSFFLFQEQFRNENLILIELVITGIISLILIILGWRLLRK